MKVTPSSNSTLEDSKKYNRMFYICFLLMIISSFGLISFIEHVVNYKVLSDFFVYPIYTGSIGEYVLNFLSILSAPIFISSFLFIFYITFDRKIKDNSFSYFCLSILIIYLTTDQLKTNPILYLDNYLSFYKPMLIEIIVGSLFLIILFMKKENQKKRAIEITKFYVIFKIIQIVSLYFTVIALDSSPINSFLKPGYGNTYSNNCLTHTYTLENGFIKKSECPYKASDDPYSKLYFYAINGNYSAYGMFLVNGFSSMRYSEENNKIIYKLVNNFYSKNSFLENSWAYNQFQQKPEKFQNNKFNLIKDKKSDVAFIDYIVSHSEKEIREYLDDKIDKKEATLLMYAFVASYLLKAIESEKVNLNFTDIKNINESLKNNN